MMSLAAVQLYYMKFRMETVAIIFPIAKEDLDLTFFLPEGRYVLSLVGNKESIIDGKQFSGRISVVSRNKFSFPFNYTMENIERIYEYHDRTPERASRKSNMRYPYTHHINGYYLLKIIGVFTVESSFDLTAVTAILDTLPHGLYLKIETVVEVP